MPPRTNPKKLNTLQLKTLTLAQEMAKDKSLSTLDPETGDVVLGAPPRVHGNHLHVGPYVVMKADATGLSNQGVWMALLRKGLAAPTDKGMALTPEGQGYETGLRDKILHGSDH